MARPRTEGLRYWSMDTDFYSDEKIIAIAMEFGKTGLAIVPMLLTRIYRQGYFIEWGDNACLLFSHWAGGVVRPSEVDEVVKGCLRCGLFDNRVYEVSRVLTSSAIQLRYIDVCKKGGKGFSIRPEFDLTGGNFGVISENTAISSEQSQVISEQSGINSEKSTRKKLNKTKLNKTKQKGELSGSFVFPFADDSRVMEKVRSVIPDDTVRSAIRDWVQRVFDTGLTLDEIIIDLHLKDLITLSSDSDKQLKIVEQAIKRGWKGFYPLNSNGPSKAKREDDFNPDSYKKGGFRE